MRIAAAAVVAILLAREAAAQEWTPLDARTRATGHVGVAFAEGPAALYWNPSLLVRDDESIFEFASGFTLRANAGIGALILGDTLNDINHLNNLTQDFAFGDTMDRIDSGGAYTEQDVQNMIQIFDATLALGKPGTGAILSPAAGFDLRIGPFGLFAHALGSVGIRPVLDYASTAFTTDSTASFFSHLTSVPVLSPAGTALSAQLQAAGLTGDSDGDGIPDADEMAFQAQQSLGDAAISDPAFVAALSQVVANMGPGATTSLQSSDTGYELRTLILGEAGVSFGLPVLPQLLTLGFSFKEIIAETAFSKVTVADLENDNSDPVQKAKDDFKDSLKRSTHFNMDLGATFFPTDWLTVAVAGRNIIPFNVPIAAPEGHLHLDPMWRMGLLVTPVKLLKFGLDVDLTRNESPVIDGYASRVVAGGLELDLPYFKIRAGAFQNTAEHGSGVIYTGGFGLDLVFLTLDYSVEVSSKRVSVEDPDNGTSQKVPTYVGMGVALSIQFGF